MATGKTTVETRFFISSLGVDPKRAIEAIGAHRGVEAMHWTLDMDFDEDRSRARTEDIVENLAMLRHVVVKCVGRRPGGVFCCRNCQCHPFEPKTGENCALHVDNSNPKSSRITQPAINFT